MLFRLCVPELEDSCILGTSLSMSLTSPHRGREHLRQSRSQVHCLVLATCPKLVGRGSVLLKNVYRSLKEAGVGVILTTLRAALTIDSLGSKPVCRNLNSTIYELNTLGFGETNVLLCSENFSNYSVRQRVETQICLFGF